MGHPALIKYGGAGKLKLPPKDTHAAAARCPPPAAMASTPQAQTLEGIVSRYRRSAADPALAKAEIEMEVRFRGVDPFIFETVLQALVAKKGLAVDDGAIAQTVNSIMAEDPATRAPLVRAQQGGDHGRGGNLVRQLTFVDGKKAGDRSLRKWPLAPPFRVRNPHALDYNVVLSGEQPLDGPFSSDASALIRVKCRASFVTPGSPGSDWRIDLTVTRQLAGSDAQCGLPGAVSRMFRAGAMTPANMLELLGLADPDSEHRGQYGYEIELEHLPGPGGAGRDAVRPSELTALVDQVLRLANPEYVAEAAYQAEIFHVAGFVVEAPGLLRRFAHEYGLKRLTPQVMALTLSEYKDIYPPTGYYLLDKADGVRAVASVRDGRLRILADELLEYPAPAGAAPFTHSTVVDGELVRSAAGPPVFHAFDVMAVRGESVTAAGYGARVARLEEAVAIVRAFGVDARVKPVVHITGSTPEELRAQFQAPVFAQRPYGTDGRILVAPGKPYSDTMAYKWKSLWDTTIDCLARRAPPSVLGRLPYVDAPGHELYLLFVGINPGLFAALGLERVPGYSDLFPARAGAYFPIQFSPSDAPMAYLYQHPLADPAGRGGGDARRGWEGWAPAIEGKVIELRCAGTGGDCAAAGALGTPDWQLVRVRDDRTREVKTGQYFGNDFRVAELTWLNYVDPFREAQLWDGPSLGYFAAPKSAMYRAQTAFTSFVKSRRIEADLAHARWVIDAAIGKGQDFGRYVKAGVRHLVGIDQDRGALSELVRRKFSHARQARPAAGAARAPTTLFALRADLTTPHADTSAKVRAIAGFPAAGADALVSNLAVHYFAGDVVHLRNFAALARDLVKVGGTVVITTMFGAAVHALLAAKGVAVGQSWDSRQDGVLKYSIRRDYAEEGLTKAGQRVGVLLPFSNGEYYEEFLVNVAALAAEFTARGFVLVATPGFASFFDDFRAHNRTMFKMLTPADFEFLGLYGEIILRRED